MTVYVINPADWIVIVAAVVLVVCTVITTLESRRIRKHPPVEVKATRVEVHAANSGPLTHELLAEMARQSRGQQ